MITNYKKTHLDEAETKIEFHLKVVVPRPEAEQFMEEIEKVISEYVI